MIYFCFLFFSSFFLAFNFFYFKKKIESRIKNMDSSFYALLVEAQKKAELLVRSEIEAREKDHQTMTHKNLIVKKKCLEVDQKLNFIFTDLQEIKKLMNENALKKSS